MTLWPWIGLGIGIFCVIRGVADLKHGLYVWGGLGILAGALLLLTPIRTEAIKLDVHYTDLERR